MESKEQHSALFELRLNKAVDAHIKALPEGFEINRDALIQQLKQKPGIGITAESISKEVSAMVTSMQTLKPFDRFNPPRLSAIFKRPR